MTTPKSTLPFFGRAYELSIKTTAGDTIVISSDAWEPEALRFTFSINQMAYKAFWFADIEIFNCDGNITSGPSAGKNLAQTVILEGDIVTVKGGYQAGNYETLWTGQVFQPTFERDDVVDFKLTLHCILGRALTTQNFINEKLPALSNQRQQAAFIASKSSTPISVTSSQLQLLSANQLPRAKSYFGNPHNYLHALSDQNGMVSWIDGSGWNTASLTGELGPVVASYAPPAVPGGPPTTLGDGTTLSLIGTPQQTLYGVNFKVLCDSRLKIISPLQQVKLQTNTIRQMPQQFGQFPARPIVPQYVVVGVRHVGDSRGNPWYTEVTAFSTVNDVIALLGTSKSLDPTGN